MIFYSDEMFQKIFPFNTIMNTTSLNS